MTSYYCVGCDKMHNRRSLEPNQLDDGQLICDNGLDKYKERHCHKAE